MPKKTRKRRARRPLRAIVSRRGVLTVEIDIDTLAFAALRSDYAYELVGTDNPRNAPHELFRIDDKGEFARDVVYELLREAEDGNSMLTGLFDEACRRAIEQGSLAFIDTRDPA